MSSAIDDLLKDSQNTETVARAWPVLKPILVEQQLIMVESNKDSEHGDKYLVGFSQAYRALEQFQKQGQASIDQSKK